MARAQLNGEWKEWIRHNVERGCSKQELYGILSREGFDPEEVEVALGYRPPPANIAIPGLRRLRSLAVELYTAPEFLAPEECEGLVTLIRAGLRRSEISTDDPDKAFRTSRTCDLYPNQNPLVETLDRRICNALGLPAHLAEPTQGQYYELAQEFKPHTDYFETYELERFSTATLGQRTWTFMVYLNAPEEGGETAFVNAGAVVKPRTGTAVIWNNLLPDGSPNPTTLHQGMPVRRGWKAIITKWFRLPRGG